METDQHERAGDGDLREDAAAGCADGSSGNHSFWQGKSGSHSTGSQHVASGMLPPPTGQYFPNFGCLVSSLYGNRIAGMPAHFGIPFAARYTNPAGYLGAAQAAFNIEDDPRDPRMRFGNLKLERVRLEDRKRCDAT